MVTIERTRRVLAGQTLRDVRLAALRDAPDAFWATWQDERRYAREDWVDLRPGRRLVRRGAGRPAQTSHRRAGRMPATTGVPRRAGDHRHVAASRRARHRHRRPAD